MFNQTPRTWKPSKSQTPRMVCPATYIICDKKILKNRTPFLSTDIRKSTFDKEATCNAIYTLPDETIKGGASPRYTALRSGPEECPTPGPADYNVVPDPTISKSRPHGKGRLYHRITLGRRDTGPSVPTKINENGYWLDEEGMLYRVPPDTHDTTLGPAFYRINEKTSYRYGGWRWSQRTSKRKTYTVTDNPGPGEYELDKLVNCQEVVNETIREATKKHSFLPRYIDEMICKKQRENHPGPASYTPKDFKCNMCPSIYPKPFIAKSKRFKREVSEVPGPQEYSVKEVKYRVSKKNAPFSACAPRFPTRADILGPGPADYYIRSPLQEKLCKNYNEVAAQVAPFGFSAERSDILSKDTYCFPSPADYTTERENKCKISVSSVFKSKVRRFSVDFAPKMTEAALKFNPTKAFNNIKNKKSHNAFELSFNSKAPCIRVFDIFYDGSPAPPDTHHDKKSCRNHCRGFFIPVSDRFPDRDECLPGPGYYNIHPSHTRAIYKAFDTHNLTIKESILKKKLKKHPRETRKTWKQTLKKNRNLRWFANGGAEYTHC